MNENIEFCARLKCEYYVKNIKMLYNWSSIPENEIYNYLNALGIFDHIDAIKWLLTHKANLDSEINKHITTIFNGAQTKQEYGETLDFLRVALVVCNKTQAIKILSSIVLYSSNPKEDIENIKTF